MRSTNALTFSLFDTNFPILKVIDSGLVREVRHSKRASISTLATDWCSRASSEQRKGRAGRVRPGICCKLYSTRTFQTAMKSQSMPELQRVPLEEVCLNILAVKLSSNCSSFLQDAPQPPAMDAVSMALNTLKATGAIQLLSSSKSEDES